MGGPDVNEKILVVDDEQEIGELVGLYLKNEGYTVFSCTLGAEALACVEREELSLAILDVMLPDMTGFDLCRRIRETHMFPIVMLTAKVEDMDKITGLTLGADDYMTKPFNILEVKARVKTILRRTTMAQKENSQRILTVRDMQINLNNRSVKIGGKEVNLTAKEFDLLQLFVSNRGKVFSRENLLEAIWKYDYLGDLRTVDVHIRRLREKIEKNPAQPEFIYTKWGVGYYFTDKD